MSEEDKPKKPAEHRVFKQLEDLKQGKGLEEACPQRKARRPVVPENTPEHPPREEWAMFKDCPKNELQDCLHYELAREVDWIRQAVGSYCRQGDDAFNTPDGFAWKCQISHLLGCVLFHVRDFFPKTPWIGIPADKRYWMSAAKDKKLKLHLEDAEFVERMGGPSQPEKLKRVHFGRDGKPYESYHGKVDHRENGWPVTYFVWRVNWHKKDKVLVAEFQEWLKRWRANYPPPRETKGQTSPRDTLKALGAMRWLARMAWDDAQVESQETLGKPLYSGKGAWDNACAKAKTAIANFSDFQKRMAGEFDQVFR